MLFSIDLKKKRADFIASSYVKIYWFYKPYEML